MKLLCSLFLTGILFAQGSMRIVSLSWTASTSTGVLGYNVFRATPTTIATQLNTVLISGTVYNDATAVIGNTYIYTATAVAAPCPSVIIASTPACGSSPYSLPASIIIPPQPSIVVTVTVSVP